VRLHIDLADRSVRKALAHAISKRPCWRRALLCGKPALTPAPLLIQILICAQPAFRPVMLNADMRRRLGMLID